MDVGQPKDYLIGIGLHLAHVSKTQPQLLAQGEGIVGHVLVVRILSLPFVYPIPTLISSFFLLFFLLFLFFLGSLRQDRKGVQNWS